MKRFLSLDRVKLDVKSYFSEVSAATVAVSSAIESKEFNSGIASIALNGAVDGEATISITHCDTVDGTYEVAPKLDTIPVVYTGSEMIVEFEIPCNSTKDFIKISIDRTDAATVEGIVVLGDAEVMPHSA